MRTEAAPGHVLDFIVAQLEGQPAADTFNPSANWTQAGPIIEREKIQLTPLNQDNPRYGWAAAYKNRGEYGEDFYSKHRQRGATPLLAAMRCYVTAKIGEEIEDFLRT